MIVELIEIGIRCECQQPGCSFTNDATLVRSDGSRVCACYLADCPDVHGEADGADPRG